jgi:hypothetical protein
VAEFQVLYWHDIPLQVRAGNRRNRVSFELAPKFQAAIDQAAMASSLIGTDEYLDGFRWSEIQEREGSAEEVAATVVAELDASYPQIDWQKTAKAIVAKNANQEVE